MPTIFYVAGAILLTVNIIAVGYALNETDNVGLVLPLVGNIMALFILIISQIPHP
jgi:hypothetical protein